MSKNYEKIWDISNNLVREKNLMRKFWLLLHFSILPCSLKIYLEQLLRPYPPDILDCWSRVCLRGDDPIISIFMPMKITMTITTLADPILESASPYSAATIRSHKSRRNLCLSHSYSSANLSFEFEKGKTRFQDLSLSLLNSCAQWQTNFTSTTDFAWKFVNSDGFSIRSMTMRKYVWR